MHSAGPQRVCWLTCILVAEHHSQAINSNGESFQLKPKIYFPVDACLVLFKLQQTFHNYNRDSFSKHLTNVLYILVKGHIKLLKKKVNKKLFGLDLLTLTNDLRGYFEDAVLFEYMPHLNTHEYTWTQMAFKSVDSVIIYSSSCHSKPVWLNFFSEKTKDILKKVSAFFVATMAIIGVQCFYSFIHLRTKYCFGIWFKKGHFFTLIYILITLFCTPIYTIAQC